MLITILCFGSLIGTSCLYFSRTQHQLLGHHPFFLAFNNTKLEFLYVVGFKPLRAPNSLLRFVFRDRGCINPRQGHPWQVGGHDFLPPVTSLSLEMGMSQKLEAHFPNLLLEMQKNWATSLMAISRSTVWVQGWWWRWISSFRSMALQRTKVARGIMQVCSWWLGRPLEYN